MKHSTVVQGLSVLLLLPLAAHAADDTKGPKKPDRPFALAVVAASPRPGTATEAEAKERKDIADSVEDVKGNVQGKYKDWFSLVDDPAQAELILEVEKRGWETGHGAVLEGHVRVFHLDPVHIVGQGGLNPASLSVRYWRQAASDMAGRLRTFCQGTYVVISAARARGVRPLAVLANDRGVDQMRAHDLAAAIASFDEASRLAPAFALAHFNRGLAYTTRSDWPSAVKSFDAAIGADPAYPKAHYYRAAARRGAGDLAGARADLDEAVRRDPKQVEAWLARGSVLGALGDDRASLADYDQVIALDPSKKGLALSRQAFVWDHLGDGERALADYEAALSAGYEDAALQYNRGRLLAKKGDEARACSAFGAAAALDGKDADMLFERGLCRAKKGLLGPAIEDFSGCVRLKPDMARAYYNRSLCYSRQGKTALASADRARALKLDPTLSPRKP